MHVPLPVPRNIERNTHFFISLRNFTKHFERNKKKKGELLLSLRHCTNRLSPILNENCPLRSLAVTPKFIGRQLCHENQTRNANSSPILFHLFTILDALCFILDTSPHLTVYVWPFSPPFCMLEKCRVSDFVIWYYLNFGSILIDLHYSVHSGSRFPVGARSHRRSSPTPTLPSSDFLLVNYQIVLFPFLFNVIFKMNLKLSSQILISKFIDHFLWQGCKFPRNWLQILPHLQFCINYTLN